MADGRPRIFSRPGNDWTDRFPGIASTPPELGAKSLILDGEMIVPNDRGGDFNAMQSPITQ